MKEVTAGRYRGQKRFGAEWAARWQPEVSKAVLLLGAIEPGVGLEASIG